MLVLLKILVGSLMILVMHQLVNKKIESVSIRHLGSQKECFFGPIIKANEYSIPDVIS